MSFSVTMMVTTGNDTPVVRWLGDEKSTVATAAPPFLNRCFFESIEMPQMVLDST